MINILKFIFIFAYTIVIFFFSGWHLLIFFALNTVFMFFTKVTPKAALIYLWRFLPFVVFAAAINLFLGDVSAAVNLALRLALIGGMTQCYRKVVSAMELADAVERMFSPLRIFKINSRDAALMIAISVAFLPILRRDFRLIRMAMRAKGMRLNTKNVKYLLTPFLTGIFKRTNEISKAITTKGYV